MSAQQAGLSEAPTLGGGVKYYVVNHPMNLTRVIPHPGLPTTMQIAPPPIREKVDLSLCIYMTPW